MKHDIHLEIFIEKVGARIDLKQFWWERILSFKKQFSICWQKFSSWSRERFTKLSDLVEDCAAFFASAFQKKVNFYHLGGRASQLTIVCQVLLFSLYGS